MDKASQQQALNLLAESAQRFSNHCQGGRCGGLSKDTAHELMRRIWRFMAKIEDETGMTNIPEFK